MCAEQLQMKGYETLFGTLARRVGTGLALHGNLALMARCRAV